MRNSAIFDPQFVIFPLSKRIIGSKAKRCFSKKLLRFADKYILAKSAVFVSTFFATKSCMVIRLVEFAVFRLIFVEFLRRFCPRQLLVENGYVIVLSQFNFSLQRDFRQSYGKYFLRLQSHITSFNNIYFATRQKLSNFCIFSKFFLKNVERRRQKRKNIFKFFYCLGASFIFDGGVCIC